MKTKKISWKQIEIGCKSLVSQIQKFGFKPDVIIAISRGGTVIGTILSHLLGCDMAVVSTKRYADEAEVGHGYESNEQIAFHRKFKKDEQILLVDDIWDDGKTLCETYAWLSHILKHNSIRIAVLYTKSKNPKTYYYKKVKKEVWITMPWDVK